MLIDSITLVQVLEVDVVKNVQKYIYGLKKNNKNTVIMIKKYSISYGKYKLNLQLLGFFYQVPIDYLIV